MGIYEYFLKGSSEVVEDELKFDSSVVERIFTEDLVCHLNKDPSKVLGILNDKGYFESYIWKYFQKDESTDAHILSLVFMFNYRIENEIETLEFMGTNATKFDCFFQKVFSLCTNCMSIQFEIQLLWFLYNCVLQIDKGVIKTRIMRLFNICVLRNLNPKAFDRLTLVNPRYMDLLKKMDQTHIKLSENQKENNVFGSNFITMYLYYYFKILSQLEDEGIENDCVSFCEFYVRFILVLLSQTLTRQFIRYILIDHYFVEESHQSFLYKNKIGKIFKDIVDKIEIYLHEEVEKNDSAAVSEVRLDCSYYGEYLELQKICMKKFEGKLDEISTSSIRYLTRDNLNSLLSKLDIFDIKKLCSLIGMRTVDFYKKEYGKQSLINNIVLKYKKKKNPKCLLAEHFVYPTEHDLFDGLPEEILRTTVGGSIHKSCLPLFVLTVQFLSVKEYLIRNIMLYKLDMLLHIREEVLNAVLRLSPELGSDNVTRFTGTSSMATIIQSYEVIDIGPYCVGDKYNSYVKAEVEYLNSSSDDGVRCEWDKMTKGDVLFLIEVEATFEKHFYVTNNMDIEVPFSIRKVCGCQFVTFINDDFDKDERKISILIDPVQYRMDRNKKTKTYNILMRREPKTSKSVSILKSLFRLLDNSVSLPSWLEQKFLGSCLDKRENIGFSQKEICMNDSFVNIEHIKESYPEKILNIVDNSCDEKNMVVSVKHEEDPKYIDIKIFNKPVSLLDVDVSEIEQRNKIKFTASQIEAIEKADREGLLVIQGPPGTGKTEILTQIVFNLHSNYPDEKILIITRSNQALSQILSKISLLKIESRYIFRLGHHIDQDTNGSQYTRSNKIEYYIERRNKLLLEVDGLAKAFSVNNMTCSTLADSMKCVFPHIFSIIQGLYTSWNAFIQTKTERGQKCDRNTLINETFSPLLKYFKGSEDILLNKERTDDEIFGYIDSYLSSISHIYQDISDIRPLEIFSTTNDFFDYILLRHGKIIGMTSTQAAVSRDKLVEMGFKYHNVIIDEANQLTDLETFMTFVLQKDTYNHKRLVLVGDHFQVSPIVQNEYIRKCCKYGQSLFERFVRMGNNFVFLDYQVRCKPTIAKLFKWRYKSLKDLYPEDKSAINPGFLYDYQWINIEDGETTPTPHYYQNLNEAEFLVSVYHYMISIGYPSKKISIITSYNGQKDLIEDVIRSKTEQYSSFKRPGIISTIDNYQGCQNDYVLLSLVRTQHLGYLRDLKRILVAFSRAMQGIYIFGKFSLFKNIPEFQPLMRNFEDRDLGLSLVRGETYPPVHLRKPTSYATLDSNCKNDMVVIRSLDEMNTILNKFL